jgi:hypothetical protein
MRSGKFAINAHSKFFGLRVYQKREKAQHFASGAPPPEENTQENVEDFGYQHLWLNHFYPE